jgi:hypothetical protein
MKHKTIIRICLVLVHIVLIAYTPWWLVLIGLFASAAYFDNYFEIIIFGIILDAIYGTTQHGIFGLQIIYTLIGLAAFFIIPIIRRRIRSRFDGYSL